MNIQQIFAQSDTIGKAVAILLLLMSLSSWVVIIWKTWLLRRAKKDTIKSISIFWSSPNIEEATTRAIGFDKGQLVTPLIQAASQQETGTLGATPAKSEQLTRNLRNALHQILARLQSGQVLLATIGSTAPFVGLLGTVWGIYHALIGMTGAGQIGIDKVAGPVGEALIMTAAGLAVAIPAVLAYNAFGRRVSAIELELEGFAHDLRELLK